MQDGWVTAGYNALNQAVMINTAAMGSNWMFFGYDPLGRCVKRWTGSPNFSAPFPWIPPAGSNPATYFYYEGWNLIQEGPAFNSASRNYIHGARVDEIVKQITPGNGWERYFQHDARGHCTLQTDAGGGIVEQYEYDAFGQPYFYDANGAPMTVNGQPGSVWGNRFLFTGREYLSDLKLYDYRNRMYQPELGRFLQPDPKHFGAGDYNLYRYCHNDPVNRVDPTGLQDAKPVTVVLERVRRMTLGSHIPHFIMTVRGLFTNLAAKTMKDHVDRSQTLFKNGKESRIGEAYYISHQKQGTFQKNEKNENIPVGLKPGEVALFLHFHDDVRPGDSSTNPSIPGADAKVVREEQASMLYSATSLYRKNRGIFITPNGQRDPVQTPIYFNW